MTSQAAKPGVHPGVTHGCGSTHRDNDPEGVPTKVGVRETRNAGVLLRHWVREELDTALLLTVFLCLGATYLTITNGSPRAPFLYFLLPPILSCWWFGPRYGGIAVGFGLLGGGMYGIGQDLPVTRLAFSTLRYGLICAIPMTIAYRMQRHVQSREALMSHLVAVDQRRDEFFANLSHEMRTPLNTIRGYCQMVTKHGARDPSISEKGTEVITRSVQYLDRLVEDMLDVSLVVKGKMQLQPAVVNPVPLLLEALEVVRAGADAKQIQLVDHLPAAIPPVRVDPMRCQQVLWNLLSNALKFTPTGGRIDVSLWRDRQVVVIAVKDTGIGMERAFVARVFERFTQANSSPTRETRGLGLGLSIAKNLVDLMGGTLVAESPGPNRGATFTVRLPVAESDAPTAA